MVSRPPKVLSDRGEEVHQDIVGSSQCSYTDLREWCRSYSSRAIKTGRIKSFADMAKGVPGSGRLQQGDEIRERGRERDSTRVPETVFTVWGEGEGRGEEAEAPESLARPDMVPRVPPGYTAISIPNTDFFTFRRVG